MIDPQKKLFMVVMGGTVPVCPISYSPEHNQLPGFIRYAEFDEAVKYRKESSCWMEKVTPANPADVPEGQCRRYDGFSVEHEVFVGTLDGIMALWRERLESCFKKVDESSSEAQQQVLQDALVTKFPGAIDKPVDMRVQPRGRIGMAEDGVPIMSKEQLDAHAEMQGLTHADRPQHTLVFQAQWPWPVQAIHLKADELDRQVDRTGRYKVRDLPPDAIAVTVGRDGQPVLATHTSHNHRYLIELELVSHASWDELDDITRSARESNAAETVLQGIHNTTANILPAMQTWTVEKVELFVLRLDSISGRLFLGAAAILYPKSVPPTLPDPAVMALKHDIFAPPGAMAMPTDPVSVLSTADESVLQTDAYERLPDQTNSGEMTWSATTDSKSILVFDAVPCGMQSFKLSYGQTCRRYRHKLTGNNYLVGGETQGKFCCSGPTVGDYSHAVIDTLLVVSEPGQRATYRLKGFKLTDDPAQTGKLFAVFSGLEVLG